MKNFTLMQFKDSVAPLLLIWNGDKHYTCHGILYSQNDLDLATCNKECYCIQFDNVKELTLRNN